MIAYALKPGKDPRVPGAFPAWVKTFSRGIGRGTEAAVFRVRGNVEDADQVFEVAERLVAWLNNPAVPCEVISSDDKSATICATKAGREQGYSTPSKGILLWRRRGWERG